MDKCFYCGRETQLVIAGEPVCTECSDILAAGQRPPVTRKAVERENGNKQGNKGKSTGS